MGETVKKVNAFFKTAVKPDIEKIKEDLVLTERQEKVFNLFYIKHKNIDFIADELSVCDMVINNELKSIRIKLIKLL